MKKVGYILILTALLYHFAIAISYSADWIPPEATPVNKTGNLEELKQTKSFLYGKIRP